MISLIVMLNEFIWKIYFKIIIQNNMGSAFLTQPKKTKNTVKHQHGRLRVVTCQMQGWRKYMQDAIVFHRLSKQIFLFAVFDGHGGAEVSQYCASHIVEVLEQNKSYQRGQYEKALQQTFELLDQMLATEEADQKLKMITIENGLQPFEDSNSKIADSVGCTANVALLVNKTLYVANAGDSRCALSRGGSIVQLSFDHKPQNPIELQRIIASGAKVEGGRINQHLNLSRCLGDLHYKKNKGLDYRRQTITCHPDVKVIELCNNDDFIIIGCDGIWQRYETNGQGLIDLIRNQRLKGSTPETVLQQMLNGFLSSDPNKEQLGCDNMSVILIELNKSAF